MRYKIGELGNVITGGTPAKKHEYAYGNFIKFLTPRDMLGTKFSRNTERMLSKEGMELLKSKICSSPSISVSCIGSDMGKTILNNDTIISNQQINTIADINKDIVIPDYLYYLLSAMKDHFQSIAGGSTMPIINKTDFSNIVVDIPDIKHQIEVINILNPIDNKIEVNMNSLQIIEEIAATLFKHWFVDFEFPDENGNPYKSSGGKMVESELARIPSGWKIIDLKDAANDIVTGKTPSTKDKDNYGTEIPFITIPDMHGKAFVSETARYLSHKGASTQSNKLIPANSICVSCIATPGLVSITSEPSQTNQQINTLVIEKPNLYYLYLDLSSKEQYIRDLGSGGSTTLNLNKKEFSKIKIVYPNHQILNKFNNSIEGLFNKILLLQKQNKTLESMRDNLLPKLLSGEIELPIEEEVRV